MSPRALLSEIVDKINNFNGRAALPRLNEVTGHVSWPSMPSSVLHTVISCNRLVKAVATLSQILLRCRPNI